MRTVAPASALALAWAATIFVFGAVVTSCAAGGTTPCARNSDCEGSYCSAGTCKKDCVDAALDCPKDYTCNAVAQCEAGPGATGGASGAAGTGASGTTSGGGTGGASTTGGASGTGGAAATGGTTMAAGMGGTAGPGGSSATGGAAATGGTGAGGTPATGGSGATAGASSSAGGSSATGGSSGASAAGGSAGSDPFGAGGSAMGMKLELDACTGDGECAPPLVCRPDFINGPIRCTRACSSKADCVGGRRCETVTGSQACVFGDVGRACKTANDCVFGCLTSQQYCTTSCVSGADCPSGYGCAAIGMPAVSVCVKLEAACDVDTSQCIAAAACDMTMVVSGCTMACNGPADCPVRAAGLPSWTCDGLCRRPSDVFGPMPGGSTPTQWACNAQSAVVNICNDAQHLNFTQFSIPNPPAVSCGAAMTTDGAPGDACTDTCREQGACAFGFSCVALGVVGTARIGLCIPHGATPTGASCANDPQCEFGYCANGKCSRDCSGDGLCPTGTTCTATGGPPIEGKAFKRCQ